LVRVVIDVVERNDVVGRESPAVELNELICRESKRAEGG
jgi:hypothetical protein